MICEYFVEDYERVDDRIPIDWEREYIEERIIREEYEKWL